MLYKQFLFQLYLTQCSRPFFLISIYSVHCFCSQPMRLNDSHELISLIFPTEQFTWRRRHMLVHCNIQRNFFIGKSNLSACIFPNEFSWSIIWKRHLSQSKWIVLTWGACASDINKLCESLRLYGCFLRSFFYCNSSQK